MLDSQTILLIENDQIDIMTMRRVLKDLDIANPLTVAQNGEEALEILESHRFKKPGLILLDLNMPRMNGLEFLSIVKKDVDFKKIPTVMLTTSKEDRDRRQCYSHSIAGYFVKPVEYNEFVTLFQTIYTYWKNSEGAE